MLEAKLVERTGWRAYADGADHEHRYFHLPDVDVDEIEKHSYPCLQCGEVFKPEGVGYYYNTPSGKLEPGNLYWSNDIPENYFWDNHKGPHLMAVCPGGHTWIIDSRASNCGSPDDRTHRCWVRTGEPGTANFTVGKAGHTCKAGGGSIWVGNDEHSKKNGMEYHGFLRNGKWTNA